MKTTFTTLLCLVLLGALEALPKDMPVVQIAGGVFDYAPNENSSPVPSTVGGFEIAKVSVSVRNYYSVMNTAPPDGAKLDRFIYAHWEDAATFANQVSLADGLEPVYRIDGDTFTADLTKSGWRLPLGIEDAWAQKGGYLTLSSEERQEAAEHWLSDARPTGFVRSRAIRLVRKTSFPITNQRETSDPTPVIADVLRKNASSPEGTAARAALALTTFWVTPENVELRVVGHESKNETWTFQIVSKDPAVPLSATVVDQLRNSYIPAETVTFKATQRAKALQAGTLRARIRYSIGNRDSLWALTVTGVEIGQIDKATSPTNFTSFDVFDQFPNLYFAAWTFEPNKRNQPTLRENLPTVRVPAEGTFPALVVTQTPITREQWGWIDGQSWGAPYPRRPVQYVSWMQAAEYCNAYSARMGLDPVYTIVGSQATADLTRSGWRLPTRAEMIRLTGPLPQDWNESAWSAENSQGRMQDVAQKKPNVNGLYDTLGPVLQWTNDSRPNLEGDQSVYVGHWLDAPAGQVDGFGEWLPYGARYKPRTVVGFRMVRLDGKPQPRPPAAPSDPDTLVARMEQAQKNASLVDSVVREFASTQYRVPSGKLGLTVSNFDRQTKQWTIQGTSQDPLVPFRQNVVYNLSQAGDLASEFKAFDALRKAGTLRGRLVWKLESLGSSRYRVLVTALELGSEVSGAFRPTASVPTLAVWEFYAGFRSALRPVDLVSEQPVEGGSFAMGIMTYPLEGELYRRPRTVSVSDFLLASNPVSQDLYQMVMGTNPATNRFDPVWRTLPAEGVSWKDAALFCNRLSQLQGLEPVYSFTGHYVGGTGNDDHQDIVLQDLTKSGWRLPTAAEFEWAARGGRWMRTGVPSSAHDLGLQAMAEGVPQYVWNWYALESDGGERGPWVERVVDPVGPAYNGENFGGRLVQGAPDPGYRAPAVMTQTATTFDKRDVYPSFRLARRGTLAPQAGPQLSPEAELSRPFPAYRDVAFAVGPEKVTLSQVRYDAKTQLWTFDLASQDKGVPYSAHLSFSLAGLIDAPRVLAQWQAAVKAGTLAARLYYRISRRITGAWLTTVTSADVGVKASDGSLQPLTPVGGIPLTPNPLFEFETGKRDASVPTTLVPAITVATGPEVTGFTIGAGPVTRGEYQSVMGKAPVDRIWSEALADYPVENVTWYDAVEFCNALSRRDGLDPVYTIDGKNVSAALEKSGWRLPWRSEYDWARQGGVKSRGFATFAGSNNADEVTWWAASKIFTPQLVATKLPNELGLYDMLGNVRVWLNEPAYQVTFRNWGGISFEDDAKGLDYSRTMANFWGGDSDRSNGSVGIRVVRRDPKAEAPKPKPAVVVAAPAAALATPPAQPNPVVSVGPPPAQVTQSIWTATSNGNLYAFDGRSWTKAADGAEQVAVGASGVVWKLGPQPVDGGFEVSRWNGTTWDRISGGGVRLAVDAQGSPWVVNEEGVLFERTGGDPMTGTWVQRGKEVKDVAVGTDGTIFSIGGKTAKGGWRIRYFGDRWINMEGAGVRVAAGAEGHLWVINSKGNLFEWSGALSDGSWKEHEGLAREIWFGVDGNLYILGHIPLVQGGGWAVMKWNGNGWETLPDSPKEKEKSGK